MKRSFYVAGVQFRPRLEINKAGKTLKIGDRLDLSPEPSNKFDPNAVKIIYQYQSSEGQYEEIFLGYVPKKFSSEVAGMIEIGAPIFCTVDEVSPEGKTYEMFKVTVQIPDQLDEVLVPTPLMEKE